LTVIELSESLVNGEHFRNCLREIRERLAVKSELGITFNLLVSTF